MKTWKLSIVLFVTIILAGCVTEETENAEPAEVVTDRQVTEDDKKVDVVPATLDLTQEQKEKYYKEYSSVVEKVNMEYNENLALEPMATFSDEYWVEVKDFKEMLKERIDAEFVFSKNKDAYAPTSVPKTVEIHTDSNVTILNFEGSFETQLDSNTPDGRQLFSALNSISSKIEKGSGDWTQTGYNYSIVDNGLAYLITAGGKYSESGVSSSHLIEVEFYCDKYGGIS